KKKKIGNILVRNLKNKKYTGRIFPINPRHKIIEGLKVHASILEIKNKIDLVVIAIPAALVLLAVDECIEKNVKNIVIISAGFSESGKEGQKREIELARVAKENELNILGPNCLGFINVDKNINTSFARKEIYSGKVGLISQSGAFVTGLLDIAKEEQIGFSKIITLGNKTVLDEIDFLEYLAKDSRTKIIGLYLENIKRGRRFYNVIAKITEQKPVLILKAGNSQKVKDAIMSHTGSMAGEMDVAKKAFRDSGALYFEDMAGFWRALKLFNNHKLLQNDNLAILTNAGGPGVIMADLIEQAPNLNFYNFSVEERKALGRKLPLAASIENPIDILGDADSKRYQDSLRELIKMKKIGAVLTLITPQAQTDIKNILEVIKTKESQSPFPIVPVLIGAPTKDVFQFPKEAVDALGRLSSYLETQNKAREIKKEPAQFNILESVRIKNFVNIAKKEKRNVFFYEESLELMRYHKINILKAFSADKETPQFSGESKQFVMKVDDPAILHKMAQGGVKTGIKSKAEFQKSLKQLRRKFKKERIIVQEQVEKGIEIIIGLKKDLNFGPVLMCGMGGILTEIFNEKILWILPTKKAQIKEDLKISKLGQIFKKEGLSLDDLAEEVYKVGKIGWQNNWLKELDINPMFFYKDSKEPLAVDVKVKINSKSNYGKKMGA
ncbi:MAG: acetate--CoA ligase family protein, partial [Candidatus Moranbacteria bacterium]|nr:acetate--CoA ligase family protein [Candidatus Moranbacteria bacterium]